MQFSSADKTIRIPVRSEKDKLYCLYGGSVPALKDGAIGELIVLESAITDRYFVDLLQEETSTEMFAAQTSLFAQVKMSGKLAPEVIKKAKYIPTPLSESGAAGWFVEIILLDPLFLILRGTKPGELKDCQVKVPAIDGAVDSEADARSINHAYTQISQLFETQRRSHTGNVFDKVFFLDGAGQIVPLDNRRKQLEADAEYSLIMMLQPWWINMDNDYLGPIWAFSAQENDNLIVYEIDSESTIRAEHQFFTPITVERWLHSNGYLPFRRATTHANMKPPGPPYRKPTGVAVYLPWKLP
jgi:hypothetical protein